MPHSIHHPILTINTGSSSLRVALFLFGKGEALEWSAKADRIALPGGSLEIHDGEGRPLLEESSDFESPAMALDYLLDWMPEHQGRFEAVGHRLVHSGFLDPSPQPITPELEKNLSKFKRLDPDHLPQELELIRKIHRRYPDVRQFACFDTAFHRDMPLVARMLPLTRELWDDGIRRFGFHGLSYESIISELAHQAGPVAANQRVIIAHLGSSVSMTAVAGGKSVETTMGLMPTGGLIMGTRPGDLDPGVLLYLLEERRMSTAKVSELVNHQSGLLGISGTSADLRELLPKIPADAAAQEAIDLFCYRARRAIGSLIAALGGVDTLVFTAGTGENSPPIRWQICEEMEFLGIRLDPMRNEQNGPVISTEESAVTVRVIRSDEERMIARHTRDLIGSR